MAFVAITITACTKKADVTNDWYKGVRSTSELSKELSKSEYPYSILDEITRKEIIDAASFDSDNHLNGFNKPLTKTISLIGQKGVQDLTGMLTQTQITVLDTEGKALVQTSNKTDGFGIFGPIGTIIYNVSPSRNCNVYAHDCYCLQYNGGGSSGGN